jgi:hypothetical protein
MLKVELGAVAYFEETELPSARSGARARARRARRGRWHYPMAPSLSPTQRNIRLFAEVLLFATASLYVFLAPFHKCVFSVCAPWRA